jgi:cytoskeleton protein RodZ
MAEENLLIGEILRQAREDQGLSLEEISSATMIKEKYLAAIEADNWAVLPSSVQQKGFTRSYASFLGLDPAPLIKQLRDLLEEPEEEELPDENQPSPPESPRPGLMSEIGSEIKSQRERLGFTISNVEDQIFIPARYLQAIESGNLEELPSTVQGKGMVKNYAQFLGMDPEPLLLSYADVLQSRLEKTRPETKPGKTDSEMMIWLKRFLANPTLLWAGVMILITAVSIWAGLLILGGDGSGLEDTATIPAVADILLPSSTSTATLPAAVTTPGDIEIAISPSPEGETGGGEDLTPTFTPVLLGNEKIQIQLIILQRTWVRVTVDNILEFEGRLIPGSVKVFGGELSIEVLTGNAAGVEVVYNQQDLGVMGLYGEVINRIYTPLGVATPTPTITLTPTPSDTPEPSITPTPTTEP